jgi:calcineurin-like phosphoesterase family protein
VNPGTIAENLEINLDGSEWITSDTHFGHHNIMIYSARPFKDKWEMDEKLILNWNALVQPNDLVIHLGDFGFCGTQRKIELLQRLNGYKILIKGNHDDRRAKMVKCGFAEAYMTASGWLGIPAPDGTVTPEHFHMRHLPQRECWRDWQVCFCGHVHEKWVMGSPGIINVGCDVWDFRPQRVADVREQAFRRHLDSGKSNDKGFLCDTTWEPRDTQLTETMYGKETK